MKSVYEIWSLAQLIGQALDFPLYISITEMNGENNIKQEKGGWVTKGRDSLLRGYVNSKNISTALMEEKGENIAFGKDGGIRKGNIILTCNCTFSEGLNYVLERSLLWYAEEDLRFHHYGMNHSTIEEMEAEIEVDQRALGTKGIYPKAFETSCFIPGPKGNFFKEHYFDPKVQTQDIHLAFTSVFPRDFAEALCESSKAQELKIDFATGKNHQGEEAAWVFIPSIYSKLRLSIRIDPVWRDPNLQ